jgi:outer membrane lipoprotein-sorting protein
MIKIRYQIFLQWLLLCAACFAMFAQTPDDLVNRYIEARGGLPKIKSVTSMRMTGSMSMANLEVPITMLMQRPNSVRMEFTVKGSTGIRAFDGNTGWTLMPFLGTPGPMAVTGSELRDLQDQADIDGALVDYKAKGNKLELAGKENVNGVDAYKLKVTRASGAVEWIYLDATTYLDIKEDATHTIQGTPREVETVISDYRDIDGLKFPFAVQSGVKNEPDQQQKLTIHKVEINVPLDSSLFHMPSASETK